MLLRQPIMMRKQSSMTFSKEGIKAALEWRRILFLESATERDGTKEFLKSTRYCGVEVMMPDNNGIIRGKESIFMKQSLCLRRV